MAGSDASRVRNFVGIEGEGGWVGYIAPLHPSYKKGLRRAGYPYIHLDYGYYWPPLHSDLGIWLSGVSLDIDIAGMIIFSTRVPAPFSAKAPRVVA